MKIKLNSTEVLVEVEIKVDTVEINLVLDFIHNTIFLPSKTEKLKTATKKR